MGRAADPNKGLPVTVRLKPSGLAALEELQRAHGVSRTTCVKAALRVALRHPEELVKELGR
jgi:hypothetical protein